MRLMMFFTPLIAIGMFWYGWSADKKVHWIVPIIGTFPIGVGMIGFFLPSFVYIIEAFGFYAASAIASLYRTPLIESILTGVGLSSDLSWERFFLWRDHRYIIRWVLGTESEI